VVLQLQHEYLRDRARKGARAQELLDYVAGTLQLMKTDIDLGSPVFERYAFHSPMVDNEHTAGDRILLLLMTTRTNYPQNRIREPRRPHPKKVSGGSEVTEKLKDFPIDPS